MVMDATQTQQPSPQSVGREFVRQYYTLLNKAPNHLHRFYNNNSSFIHGESTLVVGQKNIHNRIQQLNFHDCHAKISQVDAQATLGNGVVVQVTGELSNDGQPMRRFTQTFVLAAQSPKKYYVHNDIFRYQDLYSDEDNDSDLRTENDEEHDQTVTVGGNEQLSQQQPLQVNAGVGGVVVVDQPPPVAAQVVTASATVIPLQPAGQVSAPQQQQQTPIYYPVQTPSGRTVLAAPQGNQFAAAGGATGVPATQVSTATAVNGVVPHDDMLAVAMPQPLVAPAVVQAGAGVPVAAAIIAAPPTVGVTVVPLSAAAGLPPSAAGGPGGPRFQQSPLMPQQLLQQQQQPLLNTPVTPQGLHQTQQVAAIGTTNDIEESIITANSAITMASNENDMSAAHTANSAESTPAPIVDDFKTINEQQQQEKYEAAKQQQQQQNEPKTYANLFKSSNSSSPSGFVNAAMQPPPQSQPPPQQQSQHAANNAYQSNSTITSSTFSQSDTQSSMSVYNNRNNDNNSSSMRMDNNHGTNSQGGPLPQRNNMPRMNKDFDQRRTSGSQQYGDHHQLFLGNIPHHASEEEIKPVFARFGNVVELRILSKPGGKAPPGLRNPLNYGFLTYEDPESVHNCLASCPLYYPENSPDRQKLNVEEKKPRARSNDMPPRQSGLGSINNNGMNNAQRNTMGGGPPTRSLQNAGGGGGGGGGGGMMRGNNGNMSRGGPGGGGPRMGSAFNRNDRNGGPTNGPQVRGGNNNAAQSAGGSYGARR